MRNKLCCTRIGEPVQGMS